LAGERGAADGHLTFAVFKGGYQNRTEHKNAQRWELGLRERTQETLAQHQGKRESLRASGFEGGRTGGKNRVWGINLQVESKKGII